jgi:hypothetical protein
MPNESVERRHPQAESLRRLAWILDDVVRIPGTRIRVGLDALLGLLPAGGDVAGGVISAYTLLVAHRLGAGPLVLARMGLNILLDTIIGSVPVAGDVFDATWKSNRRNMALLDRYLETPEPVTRGSGVVVAAIVAVLLCIIIGTAVLSWHLLRWIMHQL